MSRRSRIPDAHQRRHRAAEPEKSPPTRALVRQRRITRFPDRADAYYYRALAELQMEKNDAAKADLEKFIAMAASAPEAATAKGILEKLGK